MRSDKPINDADRTEIQHIIRDSDKAGVRREKMVSNNYTSIKRLKRIHIRLVNGIQKKDSTATSDSLHPILHNGKILVTKKNHAFNGKFNTTMKRESRNRRKFSFVHSISVLNNIRRGPRMHQRVGFAQNLARKSCKMDMVLHLD